MSKWLYVPVMVLVVIILYFLLVGDRPASSNEATSGRPAVSPSGKYRLVVVKGYNGYKHFQAFQIVTNEAHPRVLFCSKEQFRAFDTTYFLWDPQDRAWVYSGDVGTFFWIRIKDDAWEKHRYGAGGISAPQLLKQRRPDYHKL